MEVLEVKPKILIVEDERLVAEDIRISLEGMGYEVNGMVGSGEDAKQHILTNQPDLILMDIVLQGEINGIVTADQIRSQYDIPIIYLTAYADSDTIDQAKKTQPYGYILKPFEDQEVHSTIEMVLYKHQMEKKLRENEAWLSTILKSIRDGVIATDTTGHIIYMNEAALQITGWPEKDVQTRHIDEVLLTLDEITEEKTKASIACILDPDKYRNCPARQILVSRNNQQLHIEERSAPIKDENSGELVGAVCVFNDITKRRKAEMALGNVIHEESVLLNAIPAMIYLIDKEQTFIRVNELFGEVFQTTPEQVIGATISDVYPSDMATRHRIFHEQIFQTGQSSRDFEEIIPTKNGPVWFSTDTIPFRDSEGKIIGVIGLTKDISERKQAEEAILKRNTQLQALNRLSSVISSTLNIEYVVKSALDTLIKYCPYTGGILFLFNEKGTNIRHCHYQDVDELVSEWICESSQGTSVYRTKLLHGDIACWHPDIQKDILSSMTNSPEILDSLLLIPVKEGPKVIGALNLFEDKKSDLTETDLEFYSSIGSQIGLAVRNARLYLNANQALEELKVTQDKLVHSEKLAVLGRLTSHVVHEIGNPLAAIMNSADVLQRKLSLDGKLKELMDIIGWETERLNRTIEQLREFARPRSIQKRPTDIKELVKRSMVLLNQDLELTWQRKIKTSFKDEMPEVSVDPDAVEQIILNLVKNALQAVEENQHVHVKLTLRDIKNTPHVRIKVTDEGMGISEEVRKRLFEPYFSTKAKGMGLGMYIVKQIIDAHKGSIRVQSSREKGTSISVYLPVNEEANGNNTGS